jgi:hypothetical protein
MPFPGVTMKRFTLALIATLFAGPVTGYAQQYPSVEARKANYTTRRLYRIGIPHLCRRHRRYSMEILCRVLQFAGIRKAGLRLTGKPRTHRQASGSRATLICHKDNLFRLIVFATQTTQHHHVIGPAAVFLSVCDKTTI